MRTGTRILASRRARRDILAAILLFSSPAFADRPEIGSGQVLPPLPLSVSQSVSAIKPNPYYQSGHPSSIPPVQQASGTKPLSTPRLKPVGSAIGLREIGQANKQHAGSRVVDVEAARSPAIRNNPLLRSVHHPNADLVQTKAVPAMADAVIPGFSPVSAATVATVPLPANVVPPVVGSHLSLVRPAQHTATSADTSGTASFAAGNPPVVVDARGRQSTQPLVASPAALTPVPVVPVAVIPVPVEPVMATITERLADAANSPEAAPITFHFGDKSTKPIEEHKPIQLSFSDSSDSSEERSAPVMRSLSSKPQSTMSQDGTGQRPDDTKGIAKDVQPEEPRVEEQPAPAIVSTKPAARKHVVSTPPSDSAPASEIPDPIRVSQKVELLQADMPRVELLAAPLPIEPATPIKPATPEPEIASRTRVVLPESPLTPIDVEALEQQPSEIEPVVVQPPAVAETLVETIVPMVEEADTPQADRPYAAPLVSQPLETRPNEIESMVVKPVLPFVELTPNEELASKTELAPRDELKLEGELPLIEALSPTEGLSRAAVESPSPTFLSTDIFTPVIEDVAVAEADRVADESLKDENDGFQPVAVQPLATSEPSVTSEPLATSGEQPGASEVSSRSLAGSEATETPLETKVGKLAEGRNKNLGEWMQGQQPDANAEVVLASEDPSALTADDSPNEKVAQQNAAPKVLKVGEAVLSIDPLMESGSDRPQQQGGGALPDGVEESRGESVGTIAGIQETRLPVAVKQLPLAISRVDFTKQVEPKSAVQAVKAIALGDQSVAKPFFVGPLTELSMERGKVRSLKAGDYIARFEIEDESICQVLRGGPNELKLIGIQNGTTRVVVYAAVSGTSEIQTRGFEIQVSEPGTQFATPLAEQCSRLNRSLNQAFPDCQVKLSVHRNYLVVGGTCDSNTTAREILRMIRKACLVPVRDQLVIQ
ncbi:MAG: hypothetical protein P8L85_04605 [Rubripirellula sp.]|nr:hypothetical protein [Rubripirellula sp.]